MFQLQAGSHLRYESSAIFLLHQDLGRVRAQDPYRDWECQGLTFNYRTKVARDAIASKIGVGNTPSAIVTIAAIQIVRFV